MEVFKAIKFSNRKAFEGVQLAVFNFYKAKFGENDSINWTDGINSLDSNEVLMPIDERVLDFNWNPHAIIEVSTEDTKWFSNEPI